MKDVDIRIGHDIGHHAAQSGLEKMADIVQTAGDERQKITAATVATALMLARLQSSMLIMDDGKPDGKFATAVNEIVAVLLPSYKEEALGHTKEMQQEVKSWKRDLISEELS